MTKIPFRPNDPATSLTDLHQCLEDVCDNLVGKAPLRQTISFSACVANLSAQQKQIRASLSRTKDPEAICALRNQRKTLMKEIHRKTRQAAFDRIDAIARRVEEAQDSVRMFAAVRELKTSEHHSVVVHDNEGHTIANDQEKAQVIADFFAAQFTDPTLITPIPPFVGSPRPLSVPFSTDEVRQVLRKQRSGRAAGPDGIEMDLYKFGGTAVAARLAQVFNCMFAEHRDIAAFHQGTLCPLPKPHKPKGKCSSLRPISLLTATRKVFSSLFVARCRTKLFASIGAYQSAYRQRRSTADVIWTWRWVAALALHFYIDIHAAVIDIQAAFDSVRRTELQEHADQDPIFDVDDRRCMRVLLADNTFQVRCGRELSDLKIANKGAAQGDGASACLFVYYLDRALQRAQHAVPSHLAPPMLDDKLDIPQLIAYADDVSRLSTSATFLRHRLAHDASFLGASNLLVNASKTQYFTIHVERPQQQCTDPCSVCHRSCTGKSIQCDQCNFWVHLECSGLDDSTFHEMEAIPDSKYSCSRCTSPEAFDNSRWKNINSLGSLLGDDEELQHRFQLAAGAFRRYTKLWGRRTLIKERTRLRVYNAVVLPVLLYNLGAVGLSEAMEQRLDAFHRRQLRAVFGVYWPKVITNDALYRKASTRPLSLVVKERRWLLFGQICRLPPDTPARKAMTAYFNAADFSPRAAGKPRHFLVTTLRNDLRNASAPAILNLECAAGLHTSVLLLLM